MTSLNYFEKTLTNQNSVLNKMMKTFSDNKKIKAFIARIPVLHEMLGVT